MKKIENNNINTNFNRKSIVVAITAIFIVGSFLPVVGLEVVSIVDNLPSEKYEEIERYGSEQENTLGQTIDPVLDNPSSEPLYSHGSSLGYFNWSSTEDWRNGTSSQVYVCDGEVGIGGYDDFEDYSEGPLTGDWVERITNGWWTFYDNSEDMCIKHEGAVDDTRSVVITDQWGNVTNSTIIVKGINVGDDVMLYICSRVNWSKNTEYGNCDFYGCRNDLRGDTQKFAAFEMDDGSFFILYPYRSGEEGTVYQKLRTVTSEDGSNIVLSAKIWNASNSEPEWNIVNRTKLLHDGGDTGCFGFYGYSDDIFYISDFWLIGGWNSGNHTTEWKNADQSVNWSKFRYTADDVSSGNQDIVITIQVSNDGLTVLDSMFFYANNGENEVDISSLPPAQYVRVITDFTTTDETKTAAVSSYSIEFQSLSPEIMVSNPYPSDGATGIPVAPTLHIDVNSSCGYQMNITWKYYDAGHWYTFGNNNSASIIYICGESKLTMDMATGAIKPIYSQLCQRHLLY